MLPGRKRKGRAPQPPSLVPVATQGLDSTGTKHASKVPIPAVETANGVTGSDCSTPDSDPSSQPVVTRPKLWKQPTLTKESTVIKSGLVKVAFHRLGMNHWKLRNMELCWDPVPSENESTCKVRLRLTIFPAKKGHSHKRQDIRISNPQSLQIVSENFVNRNVLLIQSDSDYYISTDSKNVLVDWVATLKAALAKKPGGDHPLFFITVMPGQLVEASEALLNIVDNTLLLQKPVHEELFYMTSLSSIVAFGADRSQLTWWLEVFAQRRSSITDTTVQHIEFLAISVDEVISYIQQSLSTAKLYIEQVHEADMADGQTKFKVLQSEQNDIARIGRQQLHLEDAALNASPHFALAEAKIAAAGGGVDSTDGEIAGMPRRITWSGIGRDAKAVPGSPPQEVVRQLQKRHDSSSQSMNDLSKDDGIGASRGRLSANSTSAVGGGSGGDLRLLNLKGPAGPRPPPLSYSPPSSPPPAPPAVLSPAKSTPLLSPTTRNMLAKPQKPPRCGGVSPARERYERDLNSPDYSPPSQKHAVIGKSGECVVSPDTHTIAVDPLLGSVSNTNTITGGGAEQTLPSSSIAAQSSHEKTAAHRHQSSHPLQTESHDQVTNDITAQCGVVPGGLSERSGSVSVTTTSPPATAANSPRPVPKPRRRGTGGISAATAPCTDAAPCTGTSKCSDTGRDQTQAWSGAEVTTGEDRKRQHVEPEICDSTSDAPGHSDNAGNLPASSQSRLKPAVPIRSDSISDASTATQLAAMKASATKSQRARQLPMEPEQPEDEHPYEDIEFSTDEAGHIASQAHSNDLIGSAPYPGSVSAMKTSPSADDPSCACAATDTELASTLTRDPPDGQEADTEHIETGPAQPEVDYIDEEPIYVNLASYRLPEIVDSTDDELQ
eukprot:scpid30163/ scgid6027/ 